MSGPLPPNPAELLESDRFTQLLEECKKYYDFVLIDNAPVPVVTDGIIVGRVSDLNLFVFRLNYTRKENIRYINQIALNGDLKNIYLILNAVKAKKFGYYRIYGQSGYYGKRARDFRKQQKVKS
jgi:Mrp family chromosome partitioning ATPase